MSGRCGLCVGGDCTGDGRCSDVRTHRVQEQMKAGQGERRVEGVVDHSKRDITRAPAVGRLDDVVRHSHTRSSKEKQQQR